MGDQILELLDLGHVGGRNGQHQGDAIGDVQIGGLAGVLHDADGVAGVASASRSSSRAVSRITKPPVGRAADTEAAASAHSPPPHG